MMLSYWWAPSTPSLSRSLLSAYCVLRAGGILVNNNKVIQLTKQKSHAEKTQLIRNTIYLMSDGADEVCNLK